MDLATASALASSTVAILQSTLSGAVPVLFPVIIAVVVLFGGYRVLKGLYHRHF